MEMRVIVYRSLGIVYNLELEWKCKFLGIWRSFGDEVGFFGIYVMKGLRLYYLNIKI